MVLPAVHPAPADQRRDRPVRPLLVQPRRCRAGHGLLLAVRLRHLHASGAPVRADARRLGDHGDQAMVLGDPAEQRTRFAIRQIDPVRRWKLSPMDLESLDRWDDYTAAKEAMFSHRHQARALADDQVQRQEARAAQRDAGLPPPVRLRRKDPAVVFAPDPRSSLGPSTPSGTEVAPLSDVAETKATVKPATTMGRPAGPACSVASGTIVSPSIVMIARGGEALDEGDRRRRRRPQDGISGHC